MSCRLENGFDTVSDEKDATSEKNEPGASSPRSEKKDATSEEVAMPQDQQIAWSMAEQQFLGPEDDRDGEYIVDVECFRAVDREMQQQQQ